MQAEAIELRDVNPDNLKAVLSLEVAPDQKFMVAPNAVSIAEAYDGSAGPFYRGLGFRETGEIDEGEVVMALAL